MTNLINVEDGTPTALIISTHPWFMKYFDLAKDRKKC